MDNKSIKLNYKQLVKNYWDSLTSVLRGFHSGVEFLELWVPDEDHIKSIINLVEAAQDFGQNSFELFLDNEVVNQMKVNLLKNELQNLAFIEYQSQIDGLLIQFSQLAEYDSFKNVSHLYLKGIQSAYQKPNGSDLEQNSEQTIIKSSHQSINLTALVDSKTHIIIDAIHKGSQTPVEKGLMNAFCLVLRNLTVIEASDHGLLHLEEYLRNPIYQNDKIGIIIPESMDPMFKLPLKLVRELLHQYKEKTDYAPEVNTFVPKISEEWIHLDETQKMKQLQQVIDSFCQKTHYNRRYLNITRLDNNANIIVENFSEDSDIYMQGTVLIQFERYIKQMIAKPIQVYLEELEDHNLKRRRQ